jgi:uncharacterized protein (TIGR03437 family)
MSYTPYLRTLALMLSFLPLEAQTQIGGGACANSTLNGTFFYLLGGTVISAGQAVAYEELGKLVTDGAGGVVGQSTSSLNGFVATHTLTGRYAVQGDCTGTFTLLVDSQSGPPSTVQIVDGGQEFLIASSTSDAVVVGAAYNRTKGTGPGQCATGSLSGTYGYMLSGVSSLSGSTITFAETGTVSSDGAGNLSSVAIVPSQATGQGPYSISSDCSGTTQISDSNGTANYALAVVEDGQSVLFMETDAGTTVGGAARPQFSVPQQAIVNSASFAPQMFAPGSLFSIFGGGFAQQAASAQQLPLPESLGSTRVLANGKAVPLLYAGPNQINAQLPLDVPLGQPMSLTVINGTASSNTVAVSVSAAAPGLFTYGQGQAVVQNPDGSVNSGAKPAHPGDVVVAYLTGGGPVDATGSWIAGEPAPPGPSTVSSPYSVTVGGEPATGYYLGLTPGYVGLYQANFKLPALAPGSYPIVITVGGAASNPAVISVAN